MKVMTTSEILKHVLKSGNVMLELEVSLSRILATKPHSADVDRSILSYNLVKTTDLSQLSAKTMKCYLYIVHNMFVDTKFQLRPAVLLRLKDKTDEVFFNRKLSDGLMQFENEQTQKVEKDIRVTRNHSKIHA